jgi:hypothetical protein
MLERDDGFVTVWEILQLPRLKEVVFPQV